MNTLIKAMNWFFTAIFFFIFLGSVNTKDVHSITLSAFLFVVSIPNVWEVIKKKNKNMEKRYAKPLWLFGIFIVWFFSLPKPNTFNLTEEKPKPKEISEISAEYFYEKCAKEERAVYDVRCKGKKIYWKGQIERFGDNFIHIKLLNDNYEEQNKFLDLQTHINDYIDYKGRYIDFTGVVDSQNFSTPDIVKVDIKRVYSENESIEINNAIKLKEKEKQQKINAEREAKSNALKQNEKTENLAHKDDAEWLFEHNKVHIAVYCASYVEKLAKNNYEWYDSWYEPKFDRYYKQTSGTGIVRAVGDKIKFQNGFGAWQIMQYECEYDTINQSVLDVSAQPRN